MRRAIALLLAALVAIPGAASQAQLRAALAPVQTAVDAATSIVGLAIDEAQRDGSPDQAMMLRDELLLYADALARAWELPEAATYGAEVEAALPYVQDVASAIAGVPEAVAPLSTAGETCARREISPGEDATLRASATTLAALAEELAGLAQRAPPGVETRELRGAAERLAGWHAGVDLAACVVEGEPVPFLTLRARPTTIWPTGTLRIEGATSLPGPVRLIAPALGVDHELPGSGRFALRVVVPEDAPLGVATLRASAGDLVAEANVTIERLRPQLDLTGPARVLPGASYVITVALTSRAPDLTANATVLVDGEPVQLRGGRASLLREAPEELGTIVHGARYAGSAAVAPAEASLRIEVVEANELAPPPAADEQLPDKAEEPPERALLSWILASAAARPLLWALLAALAVGLVVFLLLRRRRAPVVRTTPAVAASLIGEPSRATPQDAGFVALLAALFRRLRERGKLPRGTTARESMPLLAEMGLDAEAIVGSFERVRYGDEPEAPSWRERAEAWLREARERLAGGGG